MSDQLRLVAGVTDEFTGPLKRFRAGVKEATDDVRKHVGAMSKDWDGARQHIEKFRGVLSGISPVMSAIGLGSLGAAVSLGGVVAAVRGLSSSTRDLSLFSREVGLTVNELRTFRALGENFGIPAERMSSAVGHLAKEMDQLKRRTGQLYRDMQGMGLSHLAEKLIDAPNMAEAFKRAIDGIAEIQNPQRRRELAEKLLALPEFSAVAVELRGKAREALKQIAGEIGDVSKEMEHSAKIYEESWARIWRFKDKMTHKLLGPVLNGLADSLEHDLSDDEDRKKYLRKRRVDLDDKIKASPEGSFKREYFERQRSGVEEELRKLEAATRRGTRDGIKDALRDPQGGATFQQQNFSGVGGGNGLIHKAGLGIPGFGGPMGQYGTGTGGGSGSGGYGGGYGPGSGPLGGSGGGGRSGSGGSGAGVQGPDVPTPRGDGRGSARGARTADMMAWAMDQLRREGVPEQHLRQAAAHLVGQAHMESGLDPNKNHDFENGRPTGYGIYGARDPKGWGNYKGARRSSMVRWLEANGYARNSAEGQMRYMAREAMTDPTYRQTRRILMGEGTGNVEVDTNTITRNFEAPARINRRSHEVQRAYRTGPNEGALRPGGGDAPAPGASGSSAGDADLFRQYRAERDRLAREGRAPTEEEDDGVNFEHWKRLRSRRPAAPERRPGRSAQIGKGVLTVRFENAPAGMKTSHSMADLFSDVKVSTAKQMPG